MLPRMTRFFLHCSFFCVAVFFALQFFLHCSVFVCCLGFLSFVRNVFGLWRRLGWGDGPNLKATWTRGHKIRLPCSFFCVAVFFALQFFLHCSFFCVAVFFALQFFLHCSFFCVAEFSASPIQGTGNQCEPIVPEHARHAASMA